MGSIGAHRVLQGGEAVVAARIAEFLRVAIGGVVSTKVNRDILKVEKKLVIFEHEKRKLTRIMGAQQSMRWETGCVGEVGGGEVPKIGRKAGSAR